MESIQLTQALALENKLFIDVRSPLEFEADHIYGAINIPILDNDERAIIGTLYKNKGKQEAVETGLEYVAPKLTDLFKRIKKLKEEHTNVIIYCFRGGMRSSAVVDFINSCGIEVIKLDGGYKNYRTHVISTLENLKDDFSFVVLHGHTGIGKTEMLIELEKRGLGIIDLEYYARNSGSAFGGIYYSDISPTQKYFETQIFDYVQNAKAKNMKYLFMESESKKIGRCIISGSFWELMQSGYHILVEASIEGRVNRCVKDYTLKCWDNDELLEMSINRLKDTLGKANIEMLLERTKEKDYYTIAKFLMENYYDKLYAHSQNQYKYEFTVDSDEFDESCSKVEQWYKELLKAN
ncbi:MAG: tRNA 2-selenouridine(34) synthase MnmH [Proteocatella sp.]